MSAVLGQEQQEQNYHADYSAPDANLILSSKDGIKFCVYSNIMSMASDVFNDMMSSAVNTGEVVELQESGGVIKCLLDMIYPNGLYIDLEKFNFEFIWLVILAADKYNCRRVLEEFHVRVLSDVYFKENPIHAFALSSLFDWKPEIKASTSGALEFLSDPSSWKILIKIDIIHALKLQKLSMIRRERLLKRLEHVLIHDDDGGYARLGDIWNTKLDLEFTALEIDEDYIGSCKAASTFLSLVDHELRKDPSGSTLEKHFWYQPSITWLFNHDGLKAVKRLVRRIMYDLPCDANDIMIMT